jgi:hypothetical protein
MRTLTTLPPRRPDAQGRKIETGGRLARMRRAATEITPQAIEQIAQRVAQLLRHELEPTDATDEPTPVLNPLELKPPLVDAATVAVALGVSRVFVYDHAYELGGRRIGNGPRGRLRFDLDEARKGWSGHSINKESQAPKQSVTSGNPRRSRRRRSGSSLDLLPIRGTAPAELTEGRL